MRHERSSETAKAAVATEKTAGNSSKKASPTDTNFEFFLIVTPGLEKIAAWELGQWHPELEVRLERGGISVSASLGIGFGFNRELKVPSRVLMRLAEFGCRDFPKLFRKISGFPWEEWTVNAIDFTAATHGSRLRIKKRIEETCRDAVAARSKKLGLKMREPALEVSVRFVDDVCYLSLDTSGELLHKRGFRPLSAEAPIRETMAAALLLCLEKASADRPLGVAPELVDPMAGGGTFLLEAAWLERRLEGRTYSYENLKVGQVVESRRDARREPIFSSLVAIERDEKTAQVARANLERAGRAHQVINQDMSTCSPLPGEARRWVCVNPPYGERLKVRGSLSDYYESLFESVEILARPEFAAFILPEKVSPERLAVPKGWRRREMIRFSNGGLPVAACVFECRAFAEKLHK